MPGSQRRPWSTGRCSPGGRFRVRRTFRRRVRRARAWVAGMRSSATIAKAVSPATPPRMPAGPPSLGEIEGPLQRFALAHYGGPARGDGLKTMEGGHAGLTFGFRVVESTTRELLASLILKLAPRGVRRAGHNDVYRRAPLLRALPAAGLPVPDVPWASDREDAFGTPFVMM